MQVQTAQAIIPNSKEEKQEENRNPSWFKPGQSGNPNGRPKKGYSISETVKQMFTEQPEKKKKLVDKIYTVAAEGGDMAAARMIWAYMDGMPTQKQEVTGKDGEPLLPIPILGGRSNE